jgi:leucyl aminopeptidase
VTTYTLRKGSPAKTRTDLVVIGAARTRKGDLVPAPGAEDVAEAYGRRFKPLLTSMGFKAEPGEVLRLPAGDAIKAGQLLVVGLGAQDTLGPDKVRRAAGVAARNLRNAASVALALPADDAEHVAAVAEGFVSGLYGYHVYKSGQDESQVAEVALLSEAARRQDAVAALEEARTVGAMVRVARDWVNTPPNDLPPETFADAARERAEQRRARRGRPAGVEVEVLGPEQLEGLGCGGILGVAQGSAREARLVRLTWSPPDARGSLALVGKGVTYDSGGLNLKSGSSMATMKFDMGGAAAVLAATFAIADLGLPVTVTTYAPMVENMPSGRAMRPGDVLTTRSGRTVEITNTDAEGRLILGDAISLALEDDPDLLVDVATLTGACVASLGERVAGVFGDDATVAEVLAAARTSGELMWPLPIPEQSRQAVRETKVADVLQADMVRWGSALYAAAFLEQFVEGRPWAHLDIAGAAWNSGSPTGHLPAGATGFGVTTLVELARRRAQA